MRILISNDDGIFAPGLNTLKDALSPLGEIYIVAPEREMSATGHGITVNYPLRPKEFPVDNVHEAWSVDGTPADCVKLGIEALLPAPPDLVVSGINWGPNLGTDVLYSGTVSAAIEGVINKIPSIAVSLAARNDCDFSRAARFARKLAIKVIEHGLPEHCLCNVNIPPGEPVGVQITTLGIRRYQNVFQKRYDPNGRPYYWVAGEPVDEVPKNRYPGFITDIEAINNGYVSVTPIHFDLTDYNSLAKLGRWFEK